MKLHKISVPLKIQLAPVTLIIAFLWSVIPLFSQESGHFRSDDASRVSAPHLNSSQFQPVDPDSVVRNHTAGKPFLFVLPRGIGGTPFERIEIVKAPELSWLVDQSFYWQTRSEDVGTHLLVFRAIRGDDRAIEISIEVHVVPKQ